MPKKSGSKIVQRARQTIARTRAREKEAIATAVGKSTNIATSVGFGLFESKMPMTIMNVPTKLIVAAASYIGSAMTKGNMSRALESIGDASSSIYAYKVSLQSAKKQDKPFIAGDETGYIEEV